MSGGPARNPFAFTRMVTRWQGLPLGSSRLPGNLLRGRYTYKIDGRTPKPDYQKVEDLRSKSEGSDPTGEQTEATPEPPALADAKKEKQEADAEKEEQEEGPTDFRDHWGVTTLFCDAEELEVDWILPGQLAAPIS